MNGGRLIDKVPLRRLHEDFVDKVAIPSGLKKASTRLRGGARADGERMVRERLRWLDDVVEHSCIWPVVTQMIASDPAIFMNALAIELPDGKRKIAACGNGEKCPAIEPDDIFGTQNQRNVRSDLMDIGSELSCNSVVALAIARPTDKSSTLSGC